jgi:hypothetical protein
VVMRAERQRGIGFFCRTQGGGGFLLWHPLAPLTCYLIT